MFNTYRVAWIDQAGSPRKSSMDAATADDALRLVRALPEYRGQARIIAAWDIFGGPLDPDDKPVQGAPAPRMEYDR